MQKEDRYIVIKRKFLEKHQEGMIRRLVRETSDGEKAMPKECVVIEHDWPEYELVWKLLENRIDNLTGISPAPIDNALHELIRSCSIFPEWPTDPLHAVAILNEEVGELNKAVLQSVYNVKEWDVDGAMTLLAAVEEEAVQVAAMALRFLGNLDCYVHHQSAQHSLTVPPDNLPAAESHGKDS